MASVRRKHRGRHGVRGECASHLTEFQSELFVLKCCTLHYACIRDCETCEIETLSWFCNHHQREQYEWQKLQNLESDPKGALMKCLRNGYHRFLSWHPTASVLPNLTCPRTSYEGYKTRSQAKSLLGVRENERGPGFCSAHFRFLHGHPISVCDWWSFSSSYVSVYAVLSLIYRHIILWRTQTVCLNGLLTLRLHDRITGNHQMHHPPCAFPPVFFFILVSVW